MNKDNTFEELYAEIKKIETYIEEKQRFNYEAQLEKEKLFGSHPYSSVKKKQSKYSCTKCQDTGLYDACCRPHQCQCEAGKQFERKQSIFY